MGKEIFDLSQLSLDESGRIVLGNQELEAIERDYFAVSGGGYYSGGSNPASCYNEYCQSTTNGTCVNATDCTASKNRSCQ